MRTMWMNIAAGAGGVLVGIVFAIPLYIHQATEPYLYQTADDVPTSTVAIILGASVVRGEPSPVLRERALGALELYRIGKVQKILVSGDDSVAGFDEVSPVRRLLQAEGVADEDIFLDHAGFDTYSSMYRARDVFVIHDAIVVTQAFHLPRAVFLGRSLGLRVYGISAEQRGFSIYNYLREIPASFKAVADLMFARVPKYLGEQYPITGEGQGTWE